MPDDAVRLGDLSVRCCERVQHAVTLLPKISEAAVAEAALKTCEEIDRLESDADRVMRSAMSRLFRDNIDRDFAEATGTTISGVIFLSMHKSESGRKSLTVHPIGNFGGADYGGKKGALVPSMPGMIPSSPWSSSAR